MSAPSYNCLLPPYAFIPRAGLFLIFHVRATFRSHSVAIRLLCSVKLLSFRFLPAAHPGPHIQPPHHSTLQPPLVTRPTMLHLFIVITMEDTFLSSTTWQVSLSFFILLSRIPTLVVHMHTTKACRGRGGTTPHNLKVGNRWMRVLRLTLHAGNTPQIPVDALEEKSLTRNGIRTLDHPGRSPVILLSYPCY